MDVNARIGRRIRTLRKRRGLSQEQLGERAGVAPKYLGSVERGRENPTVRILASIATALDVEVPQLFEFVDEAAGERAALRRKASQILEDAGDDDLRRAVKVLQALVE